MKKLYFFLLLVSFLGFNKESKGQWVNIPDANFRAWLNANGFGGAMSGSMMDTTNSLITSATNVNCNSSNIADLTGIQYFDNLQILICPNNQLPSLPSLPSSINSLNFSNNLLSSFPIIPSTLTFLGCGGNLYSSLPALPSSITYLDCSFSTYLNNLTSLPPSLTDLVITDNTRLTSLPAFPATLQNIQCQNDSLSSLPSLPSSLIALSCFNNKLNTLPTLPSSLISLNCFNNQLTSLPALPSFLNDIDCGQNQLDSLPILPLSLTQLSCSQNQITILPSLPPVLTNLNCEQNLLTSLPSLPSSLAHLLCVQNLLTNLPPLPSSLISIDCDNNQITYIPTLPSSLTSLYCSGNQLTSLPELDSALQTLYTYGNFNLTCMPDLKNLTTLQLSGSITCLPNYGNTGYLYTMLSGIPLCDIFNTNGCHFYWNISGTTYIDNNSNCINDSSDIVLTHQKVKLYNNGILQQEVYPLNNGIYTFDVNTYDTFIYSVDTIGLPFSVNCPSNNLLTSIITALDSTDINMDFGFHCNTAKADVGVVSMVRDSGTIRPVGFATIKINAGDMAHLLGGNCPNSSSGQLTVTINGQATYQGVVSGATPPTSVSGNTLTWTIADWGNVNLATDFHIRIKTDTFAVINNQICVTAIASTTGTNFNTSNDTLTQCFAIFNSSDPNEKEVSPRGNILPTYSDWLTYTVHFQNTGNATAINIILKDTLSNFIDVSTFQLLGASADNFTQVLPGGIVHFNFPNINLIDSLTNEPLSHGWVQYKVKLFPGLPLGTHINNTAAIYFDFNPPVFTNTTTNILTNCTADSYAPIDTQTICSNQPFLFNGIYLTNSGIYYRTIPNYRGCDSVITLNLNVHQASLVNAGADQNVCGTSSITLAASGGISYSWNNGITNGVAFTPTSTATYTVTGTDGNGCVNSDSVVVTFHTLPTISGGSNQTVCAGSSVTLSGSGATTYTWNNGLVNNVAFTPTGITTYIVTGTDGNGCTDTASVVITVNNLPVVSGGGNQSVCAGSAVTLSGSGANSYSWNNGINDGVAFTPTGTNTYTVTGTDGNSCTNTAVVTVTVHNLPNVNAGNNVSVCAGGTVTLNGSGATSYSWNNGITNNVAFTPTATTTYTVTGTDAFSCVSTDTVVVTFHALPTVSGGSNQTVCAGSAVTLSGSGASTYTWNNGVVNNVAFTPTGTNSYIVTGTDGNGCIDTAMVTVTLKTVPTVSGGSNQSVCNGMAVTLNGSGAASYSWNNGVTDGVAFTPTGGTHIYTVTGTGANGCTNTATVTVTVHNLPTVSGGAAQSVCAGSSTTLSGSGAATYSWSGGVSNSIPFYPPMTNSYTVTGTDVFGCVNSAAVIVNVNNLPTVSVVGGLNQSVCAGSAITLNGSGAATYSWNNGVVNNVAFSPTSSNAYIVTGTDANNCVNTATVNVAVNPLPLINAGADVLVCAGNAAVLNGSGGVSYSWNNGITNGVVFTPTGSNAYTVTGTGSNGCTNTDVMNLTVSPLPTVNAGADQSVCQGVSITLTATGAATYSWTGLITNGVAFTPVSTGSYTVTGTDAFGCMNTDVVNVTVHLLPFVVAGAAQSTCDGQTVTLTATGASTYSWSGGVSNGVAFTPTTTATYNVTGTDVFGCVNTDAVVVTVIPTPPVPTITQVGLVLTSSAATGNQWYENGVPLAGETNQTYTAKITSVCKVCVTANGCTNCSADLNVAVFALGINPVNGGEGGLVLYPNPTKELLVIELLGYLGNANTIHIYDVLGRECISPLSGGEGLGVRLSKAIELNVSSLSSGVYFVKVTDEKGNVRVGKFVKE